MLTPDGPRWTDGIEGRWAAGVAAALVLLGSWSCRSVPQDELPNVAFTVDSTLLGERFEAAGLGFAVRSPSGWDALPDSVVGAIASAAPRARGPGAHLVPEPIAVYRDPRSGATFSVSRPDVHLNRARRDSLREARSSDVRMLYGESNLRTDAFAYVGYRIDQIVATAPDRVVITLLVYRPETGLFQLEYVVPRSAYSEDVAKIESSVGSLEFVP
jgi:hypothetical protein